MILSHSKDFFLVARTSKLDLFRRQIKEISIAKSIIKFVKLNFPRQSDSG